MGAAEADLGGIVGSVLDHRNGASQSFFWRRVSPSVCKDTSPVKHEKARHRETRGVWTRGTSGPSFGSCVRAGKRG